MMTQPHPLPTTNAPQEGFVLIVGLVILGLLTMLALSSMRDTTMQEKMAGASRDSGLAFQAAESALRDAENCITGTTADCTFDAIANDAHFAQDDAAFPNHNTLFDAATWVAYDPPGDATDLEGIPSKAKGDAADGVNYIIRHSSTVASEGNGGELKDDALTGCSAGDCSPASAPSQEIYEITARGTGASGAGQAVLRVYYRN